MGLLVCRGMMVLMEKMVCLVAQVFKAILDSRAPPGLLETLAPRYENISTHTPQCYSMYMHRISGPQWTTWSTWAEGTERREGKKEGIV